MDGIRFRLNGEEQLYEGSAADRLLDALRDTYRMTSVKCGCREGECGPAPCSWTAFLSIPAA